MTDLEPEKMEELLDSLWLRLKSIAVELNEATGIGVLVATRYPNIEFNGFSEVYKEELYLNILPRNNGEYDGVKVKPQDCERCCVGVSFNKKSMLQGQALLKSDEDVVYSEENIDLKMDGNESGIKMEFDDGNDELEVIPDINTIENMIKGEYANDIMEDKGGLRKHDEQLQDSFYPWDCPVCGKTIRSHVNRHLKSHPNFQGIETVLFNNKKALKVARDASNMQLEDEEDETGQDSALLEDLDFKGENIKTEENSKNPYKPTECTVCGKIIRSNMKRHMRSHPEHEKSVSGETKRRDVIIVECSICGKPVRSDNLTKHVKTHDSPSERKKSEDDSFAHADSFECFCGKSFKNAVRLKCHVQHNHKEKRFKCDQCDKAFYKQNGLNNHLWVHKEGKEFKCDECGKEFKNPASYKLHMYRHRHGISFDCSLCNKSFQTKKSAEIHRLTKHEDTDIAPYLCPECGKGFFHSGNFQRHLLLHKGIKRFKCEDCGLSFSQNTQLQAHRVCHGIPNTKKPKTRHCEICGKQYSSAGNLFLHMRRHSNDKRYKCQECGKAFHSSGNYKRHMMLHTGDKPFTCDSCGKDFRQLVALKAHIRTHTGEKPYKCHYCPSEYSDSRGLKKHLSTHVGQQPKQEMQLYS